MYLFTICRFAAGPMGVAYVLESKARIVEAAFLSNMSKQRIFSMNG